SSFLALLDTPITRWLRPPLVRGGLLAAGVAGGVLFVLRPQTVLLGVVQLPTGDYEAVPAPGLVLVAFALLATYLYALAAALLVLRAAPRGSATRRKATWFAIAFGVKDLLFAAGHAIFASGASPEMLHAATVVLTASGLVVFILLLGYALLREQVLDIELKLKWTLSRTTLASIFVATFFVASELAQQLLGDRIGSAYIGTIAAGALVFAIAPLQRFADRLAHGAMPAVHDTPEYRAQRRREIYRASFESALGDGGVTDKERSVLATLASELGLTPKETLDLEREVQAARGAT
ncbi:MAG TPA: hypothetical protein VM582_01615, partial [Candidatus Thermoplasmatota archaeon]|nr:hypothetical protein [Candidatus Thermoplasmatota archaeon]